MPDVDHAEKDNCIGNVRLAQEFLEAGIALQSSLDEPNILTEPIYFLYHHSVELLLKALLVGRGVSQTEIVKIGHNIEKAVNLALDDGVSISDETLKYFEYIPVTGGQVNIRYFKRGWRQLLAPNYAKRSAILAFKELAPKVYEAVGYAIPDELERILETEVSLKYSNI